MGWILQDIAIKNNLAFTGGSDFHGNNDNGVDLSMGGESLPEHYIEHLGKWNAILL